MHPLLKEIFSTHQVVDETGNIYELHSSIDPQEGEFIGSLIRNNNVSQSIEIGCAYGISSVFICAALSKKKNPRHIMIDPAQSAAWHGVGVSNLRKAGFSFFELIEKPSEIALPELLAEGKRFEFGFIDGFHTFDHTLIDFFYLNRILKVNGIIIFDDVYLPSVKKVVRYAINYPSYKIIGSVPTRQSRKRRSLDGVKRVIGMMMKFFPQEHIHEIFSGSILKSDQSLQLNSSMIALQKIKPDERGWDWFEPF